MNLSLSIARRYLFSRGNRNVVNVISGIAATGVAIGSLAMIIVLSGFNGIESLVAEFYTTVDPDIRVLPSTGKTIAFSEISIEEIEGISGVERAFPILEETVFLQFGDQQSIVTMKGIPEEHLEDIELEDHVIEGRHGLSESGSPRLMLGYGIADQLDLFISEGFEGVQVYAAKRDGAQKLNPESKFIRDRIVPGGIVALNPEFDFKYVLAPYGFAERMLERPNACSFIDLALEPNADAGQVKEELMSALGSNVEVKTRIELNDIIFKTSATEKWVTFFILSFILIVATFNLIGSLTMLILDKRKDISLLRSIGQTVQDGQRVFLFEGLLITGLGAAIGLGLGIALVLIQTYIGFFPLEGGLVEFYPVELRLIDIAAVVGVVFLIGFVSSVIPVRVLLRAQKLQTVSVS